MDETYALLVVSRALVDSYPTWTDEHGTNVDQLAAIAVKALAEQGLLAHPADDRTPGTSPVPTGRR